MKLLPTVLIACQICAFAPQGICQQNPAQPDRLHLIRPFPDTSPGRVELSASSVQRDSSNRQSESILQLKGNVEVRMITCGPTDRGNVICDKGSMVLHADAVDYNEKTGDIHARGDVHITPYRAKPRTAVSK